MRTLDYKLSSYGICSPRILIRGLIFVIAAISFLSANLTAETTADENIPSEAETNGRLLTYKADKFYWDLSKSLGVLNGNVRIVQGKTVIVSDNAQIFLIKDAAANQKLKIEAVERLVANGNVRIEIELGVATSGRAVYITKTKILRLSGTPEKLAKFEMSDGNTITGSAITVDREAGSITVDNAEAVIFSEGDL